jgi:hypothetical protein
MGRPIDKRKFGNTNTGGIGGESLDTTITGITGGAGYGTGDPITISAPDLEGGVQAVATVLVTGDTVVGFNTGITPGSGYTSPPTLTFEDRGGLTAIVVALGGAGYVATDTITLDAPATGGTAAVLTVTAETGGVIDAGGVSITTPGTGYASTETPGQASTSGAGAGVTFSGHTFNTSNTATATATLTTTTDDAVLFDSFIHDSDSGSSNITGGDIVQQKGSKIFEITNAQGTGLCRLVTSTPASVTAIEGGKTVGEMRMSGTDSLGKTYYVTKISGRTCTVSQYGAAGWEFEDGAKVGWNLVSATVGKTIVLDNA